MKFFKFWRYDYYAHHSGGRLFDYFGGIGRPYKIWFITALIGKLCRYQITLMPKGVTDEKRIYIRAALLREYPRHCYKMRKIIEGKWDEA